MRDVLYTPTSNKRDAKSNKNLTHPITSPRKGGYACGVVFLIPISNKCLGFFYHSNSLSGYETIFAATIQTICMHPPSQKINKDLMVIMGEATL